MRTRSLASCKVDAESSPQLAVLIYHWRKRGYPSVEVDLRNALRAIASDVDACHGKPMSGFSSVLNGKVLYRYRCKNSHAREGARGGWRILALFDKVTNTLYPVLIFPKKAMPEAPADEIIGTLREMLEILRQRTLPGAEEES